MQYKGQQDSQQNSNVKLISQLRHAIYNLLPPQQIRSILKKMTLEDIEIAWSGGREIQPSDFKSKVSIKSDAIGSINGSDLLAVAQQRKIAQQVKKLLKSVALPGAQVDVRPLRVRYKAEAAAITELVQEQLQMPEKIAGGEERVAGRRAELDRLWKTAPILSSTPSLFSTVVDVVNTLASWGSNVRKALVGVLVQIVEAITANNEDTRTVSVPGRKNQGEHNVGSNDSTMNAKQALAARAVSELPQREDEESSVWKSISRKNSL